MMTLLKGILCSFIFFSHFVFAEVTPFTIEVFNKIKADNKGQQWLMLLWSVDCPPCFKELALIQTLRKENSKINVVIVNTDADDEAITESHQIMEQYQLSDITTYYFEDGTADRNRYVIDPFWYGELPRSYFVEQAGKFHGKSGLVDPALIRKWLL